MKKRNVLIVVSAIIISVFQGVNPLSASTIMYFTEEPERLDSLVESSYDSESSTWQRELKCIYRYNEQNQFSELIELYWDEDISDWKSDYKSSYTYDVNNQITKEELYFWDDNNTNTWVKNIIVSNTLNENQDVVLKIEIKRDGSNAEWENYEKDTLIYVDSKFSNGFKSYWNKELADWQYYSKEEYEYDLEGNRTSYHRSLWDTNSSEWINFIKTIITYDINNHRKSVQSSNWDETNSEWLKKDSVFYEYDANGNPELESFHKYDQINSEFVKSFKYENNYDVNVSYEDLIAPPGEFLWIGNVDSIINKPLGYMRYKWVEDISAYAEEDKYEYHFSNEESLNVSDNIEISIELVPNPVSEYFVLKTEQKNTSFDFSLFDVNGRLVKSGLIQDGEKIYLKTVPSGTYIYNLNSSNRSHSGVLIKK